MIQKHRSTTRKFCVTPSYLSVRASPSFEWCDLNKQLPCVFVKYLNEFDFESLSCLIESCSSQNCQVQIGNLYSKLYNSDMMFWIFKHFSERHPDIIACVQNTTALGNKIHARLYLKGTDNVDINKAIARNCSQHELTRLVCLG